MTASNDIIYGTSAADTIFGHSGDDSIWGNKGDDVIFGNNHNDFVVGNSGNDSLYGSKGDDTVYGHSGDDVIYGNSSSDVVYGGTGNDVLFGGKEQDFLSGGEGSDALNGNSANDIVVGGKGDDELRGGTGADLLNGNTGDDAVFGGKGDDTLLGGWGEDTLEGNTGDDVISAQLGDDLVYGNKGNDYLHGGHGSDTLIGGSGNDLLIGDNGAAPAAPTNLVVNGSFEDPVVGGGYGIFTSIAGWTSTIGSGVEVQWQGLTGVNPTDGNQKIELDSNNNSNIIQDVQTNGADNFTLSFDYTPRPGVSAASNPIEVYWNGALLDTITGGTAGWNTYSYNVQGAGATTALEFRAAGTSDSLGGYLDNVQVLGAAQGSNDVLEGGQGNDTLNGGYGDDILTGGGNADIFAFTGKNIGNDIITDFDGKKDLIDVSLLSVTSAALDTDNNGIVDANDAAVSAAGSDLLITLAQGTITVAGLSTLDVSDFITA